MIRGAGAAVVVCGLLLSGCGGSGSKTPDLSSTSAAVLQKDAAALAAAARSGKGSAVQAALAVLKRDVAAQRSQQGLSAARADRVLSAAALVAADVPVVVATPQPVATTQAPAPKAPPAPPKGHGKHRKHGDG